MSVSLRNVVSSCLVGVAVRLSTTIERWQHLLFLAIPSGVTTILVAVVVAAAAVISFSFSGVLEASCFAPALSRSPSTWCFARLGELRSEVCHKRLKPQYLFRILDRVIFQPLDQKPRGTLAVWIGHPVGLGNFDFQQRKTSLKFFV